MLFLLLAACQPDKDAPVDDTETGETADTADSADTGPTPDAPAWDAAAADVACTPGAEAPLLDAALADAGLAREDLGYTRNDWSAFRTYVDDPFNLSWYQDVHHNPEQAPCFLRQVQADLDAGAAGAHPVAGLISAYAPYLDFPLVLAPVDPAGVQLRDALARLVDAAGGGDDPAAGEVLDPDLAAALTPVLLAIADAIDARHQLDAAADGHRSRNSLYNGAPGMLTGGRSAIPDVRDSAEIDWFTTWWLDPAGPRALADQARRVAFAVEDAQLGRFAGQDFTWAFSTEAGAIRFDGPGDDDHTEDDGAVLLQVDLGGNDTWKSGAGANLDEDNPVSVVVDLGGDDTYGYEEVPTEDDPPGVPSDADGRSSSGGYSTSASDVVRQGAGRYGVGLLFDLGGGADRYTSPRMSQGFGTLGVGVLADDGGDDAYTGEAATQGAGIWGLGLLYDGGGNDVYTAWAYSQGFAWVGSGGLAYDRGGDDTWRADPGRDYGGTTLYYSPQLASGQGNSSMSQAAGFGFRGDSYGLWWSGGFATLRDASGNDEYVAGVFAQGTGYWQGTGLLADGEGNDQYDALWYIQGGAAHFALALFSEGGGDDTYNANFTPYNVSLGSGHDFSVGVFLDEGGDDHYVATTLAAGASNCQGIGVFVDNDGADTYDARSTYGFGLGNHSGECDESTGRTGWESVGLFLDGGGDEDSYLWPDASSHPPANDASFGVAWAGTADEFGGAVDGDGETNLHAR